MSLLLAGSVVEVSGLGGTWQRQPAAKPLGSGSLPPTPWWPDTFAREPKASPSDRPLAASSAVITCRKTAAAAAALAALRLSPPAPRGGRAKGREVRGWAEPLVFVGTGQLGVFQEGCKRGAKKKGWGHEMGQASGAQEPAINVLRAQSWRPNLRAFTAWRPPCDARRSECASACPAAGWRAAGRQGVCCKKWASSQWGGARAVQTRRRRKGALQGSKADGEERAGRTQRAGACCCTGCGGGAGARAESLTQRAGGNTHAGNGGVCHKVEEQGRRHGRRGREGERRPPQRRR